MCLLADAEVATLYERCFRYLFTNKKASLGQRELQINED